MDPAVYFQQRCGIVELFYTDILLNGYTPAQAAGRCLEAYRGGSHDELTTLSVVLGRLARHDPAALPRFSVEVQELCRLAAEWCADPASPADERLQEDMRLICSAAPDAPDAAD